MMAFFGRGFIDAQLGFITGSSTAFALLIQ
jgi:hypothetical protein